MSGGNWNTRRKTTDLPQVTDKLYHIMLHRVHIARSGLELTTLVVIGIDCIGSCKFENIPVLDILFATIYQRSGNKGVKSIY
jgi:hypothetical protein